LQRSEMRISTQNQVDYLFEGCTTVVSTATQERLGDYIFKA